MSSTEHDTFVVIFGVVAVAHLALAWLTWQRNARRWRHNHLALVAEHGQATADVKYRRSGGPFANRRERLTFNLQIGLGVFFGLLAAAGGLGAF